MTTLTTPTTAQLEDPRTLDERQARVIWTLIAEPGDPAVTAWNGDSYANGLHAFLHLDPNRVLTESEATAIATWRPRVWLTVALNAIEKTIRDGIHVIIPGDPEWPTAKLARLGAEQPIALYVRGDATLLNAPRWAVAVLGSRASSGYGEHVTMEFTAALVDRDVTILTGAAYGIDAVSIRAALASKGHPIAVLAGGLDRFYPAGHDELLGRVVAAGAVVSEMPVGTVPTRFRFQTRNRIIAALSDAVIITEAGYRSGSLHVAGIAKTLGVPVGAVPGPITSASSAGCHRLLRDSQATVITAIDEIMELLPTTAV